MKQLCEVLGHADRHAGFADYSRGLMLPIERKSVEPHGGAHGPLACERQAPVPASCGGAVGLVRMRRCSVRCALGRARR